MSWSEKSIVSIAVAGVVLASACARRDSAQEPLAAADSIYYGGPIITVNDAQPTAEAVAVVAGRIAAVGSKAEVMKLQGEHTRMVDLAGHTLIPGFVDAHGHVSSVGLQAASANLLAPPDGPNTSIADIQQTLREFMATSPNPKKFGVVIGFGYDDAQLREQRHPTRDDLDPLSTQMPIVVMHQSGHLGALNSVALERAGITAASGNPPGGTIRRREGSNEPNGVLEENAFFVALAELFPQQSEADSIAMLEAGEALYISYGYTTLQDGRASPGQVRTAIAAARAGKLKADVVAYLDALMPGSESLLQPPYYRNVDVAPQYTNHLRIGGLKLTLDGSPQGKTAWLSQPYFKPPQGQTAGYAGYGVVDDEKVVEIYTYAQRNRCQTLTHANGDRAIDQMISSMRKAQSAVPGDVRPVLIHGQTLREDQVEALKELHIFPSLFPMHTFYWGDWYRESVLGPERAENISPLGWLMARGMMFTSHHDAPVAMPDSMRVLSATVNRTTRSNYVLGSQHRVEPSVALKAMTLWAAYQHFEEKTKGSIESGKLADLVVLSDNPLTIERAKLANIKVLETIKADKTIYRAPRPE